MMAITASLTNPCNASKVQNIAICPQGDMFMGKLVEAQDLAEGLGDLLEYVGVADDD